MGAWAGRPSAALLWALALLALPRVRGDCSTLPTFQNARPEENYDANKIFVDGTTITYRCDTGYVKIPGKSDSVTCQGVEWSEIPQFCDRSCNAPQRFLTMQLDATFINKNYFPINSTVTFVCRPGHTLSKFGQLISTCQENGTWSSVSGSCKKKSCPNPESLDNGRVEILTDILFGSQIEYSCEEGYTLIGDSKRLCEIAGNKVVWSGDVPVCKGNIPTSKMQSFQKLPKFSFAEVRCEIPQVDNAVPISGFGRSYTYRDTIIFECKEGYILQSNDKITCEADNNWSPALPVCYKGSCNAPQQFLTMQLNATFINKNYFPINSTVTFVCRPGHTLSKFGQLISTCQENGTWSSVSGSCKKKSCPNPESLDNGRVEILTDILFGSQIEYSCEEGYTLIGDSKRLCEIAGNKVVWSGDVPVCKVITCVPPPNIQNGEHSDADKDLFSYGETVTYRCDSSVRDRFSLIGSNTIFCDKDGQWNTMPPQCKEVRCEIPQVDNAVPISGFGRSYTYRDTIIFECEKGYILQNNNKITCEADNNWSPALPVCYKEASVPPKEESQGLGPGIIFLIVITIVIALVIITIIIYRQKNRKKGKSATISVDYKASSKQENHSEESRYMVSEN
ncbi:complement component receptor 1-like protein [Sarcophilus harrisii]|nr:complement component receptor 1-like protein [Sarcophilus harrisii]